MPPQPAQHRRCRFAQARRHICQFRHLWFIGTANLEWVRLITRCACEPFFKLTLRIHASPPSHLITRPDCSPPHPRFFKNVTRSPSAVRLEMQTNGSSWLDAASGDLVCFGAFASSAESSDLRGCMAASMPSATIVLPSLRRLSSRDDMTPSISQLPIVPLPRYCRGSDSAPYGGSALPTT